MKITLVDKETRHKTTTINVVEVSHLVGCTTSLLVVEENGLGWTFNINEYGFKIEP